jgi:hypothetical protein
MTVMLTPQDRQKFTLHKTAEELAELSPAERQIYDAVQEETVFGLGFKRDAQGRPVEQGIGGPLQQTHNHLAVVAREKSSRDLNEALLAAAKKGA